MCLSNVSRCSYFIGILGEQYGTEFGKPSDALLCQYPWLAQRQGRSFTELECVCGAIGPTPAAKRALFYFRIPGIDTSNPAGLGPPPRGPQPGSSARIDRLMALKHEIRAAGLPVREFSDPGALAQVVFDDLRAVITEDFPIQ